MKSTEDRVAGSLLKLARTWLGLSQTAFADLLGIAQPTLSAYESGRRQPTLPTLLRLLARAGLELRMELADLDNHDAVLGEWERTLDDATRERLMARGFRLTRAVAQVPAVPDDLDDVGFEKVSGVVELPVHIR